MELTFDMSVLIGHLISLLYAELSNSCSLSREGTRNTREILIRVRVNVKLQKPKQKYVSYFLMFMGLFFLFYFISQLILKKYLINELTKQPTKHNYSCNSDISIIWVISISII